MCHLTWLSSRKYGTVWYHPASSKLWNLTTVSFVNFQEKLTGTSWNLCACEASLFGLLCAWREVQILRKQAQQQLAPVAQPAQPKPCGSASPHSSRPQRQPSSPLLFAAQPRATLTAQLAQQIRASPPRRSRAHGR
jgi:hypothetical protein